MKTAVMLLMCFAACGLEAAVNPTLDTKDELLSLLDEVSMTLTEPNRPAKTVFRLEPEPQAFEAKLATTSVEPVVEPDPNTPVNRAVLQADASLEESRRIRKSFFRDKIEAVETVSAEQQEKNLDQLISQLNSLVPPKQLASETKSAPVHTPEANDVRPAAEQTVPIATAVVIQPDPNTAAAADPNLTTDPLLIMIEKADSIVNPMLLADALFRKGYSRKAYDYYQQAAKQIPAEDVESTQWILFQMANCCLQTDPARAILLYTELLDRFPNSRWSGSAKSHKTTLEWMMNETLTKYVSGR